MIQQQLITSAHTLPIQIRFDDIDAFGHLYNGRYVALYDTAKVSYFDAVQQKAGLPDRLTVVIASLKVDFYASVFHHEMISVRTTLQHIGTKSLTLKQQIIDDATLVVKCEAVTTMVYVNMKTQTSSAIPAAWREALNTFESEYAER